MKRPLAAVVSFYAIGLLLAEIFQPPPAVLFFTSFFILVLALVLEKFRPILICLLLALVGWTNLVFHTAIISPDDLRNLTGNETEIAAIRGILIETPKIKISERDDQQIEHSLAQVRVAEIRRDGNWQPALGKIIVSRQMNFRQIFSPASPLKFPASFPNHRRRWPKDFLTTTIICRRAAFITNSKPFPQTTGSCGRRFCPRHH